MSNSNPFVSVCVYVCVCVCSARVDTASMGEETVILVCEYAVSGIHNVSCVFTVCVSV